MELELGLECPSEKERCSFFLLLGAEEEEETVQTQTKAQKLAEKMWGK